MKIINKIVIIFLSTVLFMYNYTYASFADYTDEEAEKNTQKMIMEYEKNFDITKSENNYLKSLDILSGGVLSPEFDKQIVEYEVKVESNINEISIIAQAEDDRAKINGNGKISIKDITDCKVEVIAESGTVRTYFLKIIREKEDYTNIIENNIINEENESTKDIVSQKNLDRDNVIEKKANDKRENILNNESKPIEYKKNLVKVMALFILIAISIILIKIHYQKNK